MPLEYRIFWIKYPALRVLVPLIFGVVAANTIQTPMYKWLWSVLIIDLGLLIMVHYRVSKVLIYQQWFGVGVLIFFLLFGFIWSQMRNELFFEDHYSINGKTDLISRIYSVEEKDRFWDCYSDVIEENRDSAWYSVKGKLLIRVTKNFKYLPVKNDIVRGDLRILHPDHRSAPYEFDWADLLSHRNIHYLTYADTSRFMILHKAPHSFVEKCSIWSDSLVSSLFENKKDYPVATAMLLGLRKKIDPELYRAYSATGAVHVLAVSGLHVGILAQIIGFILGFILDKFRPSKLLVPAITLTAIWAYTILTGATPSIMRAAVMFSSFIVGRLLQKDIIPLNLLAAAAFLLIIYNPNDIYNIGFQLSFGAMAGILLLYEPIRKMVITSNKFLQAVWKACSVSLAAQLFIYPLVGFHFHQFAFYFWLTSLISTPFSFLILVFGMIIFPIKALSLKFLFWLKYPLVWSVHCMNEIITFLYTLPLGNLGGWWPSLPDCILLIFISLLMSAAINKKSYLTISYFLLALSFAFVLFTLENIRDIKKVEMIASTSRGKQKVWIKNQGSIIQLVGDSITQNSNYVDKYNIQSPDFVYLNTGKQEYFSSNLIITKSSITYNKSSYILIGDQGIKTELSPDEQVNFIVLSNHDHGDTLVNAGHSVVYEFEGKTPTHLSKTNKSFDYREPQNSFIQIPLQ